MSLDNIDQSTIVLLAAATALIVALLLGVLLVARTRNRLQQRMTRINQRYTGKVVQAAERVSMKRKTSLSSIEGLDKVLQKVVPRPAALPTTRTPGGVCAETGSRAGPATRAVAVNPSTAPSLENWNIGGLPVEALLIYH